VTSRWFSVGVTVLTEGDAGLRAIQKLAVRHADHALEWFHISMRVTNLRQIAKSMSAIVDGGVCSQALAEIDRARWRLWNGHTERGIVGLAHLVPWAQAPLSLNSAVSTTIAKEPLLTGEFISISPHMRAQHIDILPRFID